MVLAHREEDFGFEVRGAGNFRLVHISIDIADSQGLICQSQSVLEIPSTFAMLGDLVTNVGCTMMIAADGGLILLGRSVVEFFAIFEEALRGPNVTQYVQNTSCPYGGPLAHFCHFNFSTHISIFRCQMKSPNFVDTYFLL